MTEPVFEKPPVYIPRRDHRFEYVTEALEHIEETQCVGCIHNTGDEYPTSECPVVDAFNLGLEIPVPEFLDLGDHLVCTARVQKLATGGPIQGSLQSDTIPALLDNGYVIPKRKVSE